LDCFQGHQPFSCLQRSLDVCLNDSDVLDAVLNSSMPDELSNCTLNVFDHLNFMVVRFEQENWFDVSFDFWDCSEFSLFLFEVKVFDKQRNKFMAFCFEVLVKIIILFNNCGVSQTFEKYLLLSV
jgi:hypothetical protein